MSVSRIIVLGGGPAGLGVAYFATKRGIPVTVIEKSARPGGNARTIEIEGFRFDTGAHRLHDKVPAITSEIQDLLGDDLQRVEVASAIMEGESYRQFPLDPLDLLKGLGGVEVGRSALSLLRGRLRPAPSDPSFRDVALRRFGERIAERYLLGYSRKLWGRDPALLSPLVSGARLKGLDLHTLLSGLFRSSHERTRHLDGRFYYPRLGIGMLSDALTATLPPESLRLRSGVTRIEHKGGRIERIVTERSEFEVTPGTEVVSTLPLDLSTRILQPGPSSEILKQLTAINYRTLRLICFGIRRSRLSPYASIYLPEPTTPFTRLYESTNRSLAMAPEAHTSVALELPTDEEDRWWSTSDREIGLMARALLKEHFGVDGGEIVLEQAFRIPHAYPILTREALDHLASIRGSFDRFENLQLIGRNQTFRYQHLHDLLKESSELIDKLQSAPCSSLGRDTGSSS